MTPRSPVRRSDGSALALADAVDGLPRAPAREQHAVGLVEDDDRLAALLDEHRPRIASASAPHGVLTQGLRIACARLTAPELTCRSMRWSNSKGETMRLKVSRCGSLRSAALALATAAAAAVIAGTPGDDVLRGTRTRTRSGFAGNDIVYARDGADDVARAAPATTPSARATGDVRLRRPRATTSSPGGDRRDRLSRRLGQRRVGAATATTASSGNKGDDVVSGGDGRRLALRRLGRRPRLRRAAATTSCTRSRRRPARSPRLRPRVATRRSCSAPSGRARARGLRDGVRRRPLTADQEEGENADADTDADQ